MSGDAVPLDELEIAYRRVSRALYRAQEDALDFSAEEIIAALERDQTIVDAAFFVLIFGQVESRINGLASSRLTRPEQRSAIREAKFEQRLARLCPVQVGDVCEKSLRIGIKRAIGLLTAKR
jgi:hypothetical protein